MKIIFLISTIVILTLGAGVPTQYSYLDKCNVAMMKPIEQNVMGVSYNCGTDSTDFEKRTMVKYAVDSAGRIIFLDPFYYELIENDGTVTKYSDMEQDGWNGNELVITSTVPITVEVPTAIPSNYMRG
jgi:hypothetical protein